MRVITLLIAFITLITAQSASADIQLYPTKIVRTLVVCGHGIDCKRARRIFKEASHMIEEAAFVRLEMVDMIEIDEAMSGDDSEQMLKWQVVTSLYRLASEVGATIVFTEPYDDSLPSIDFQSQQILGRASDICVLGQQDALAYAKIVGSDKVAARIVAHEMGHLAGAFHDEHGEGIMAAAANLIVHTDTFSQGSLDQMHACVYKLP